MPRSVWKRSLTRREARSRRSRVAAATGSTFGLPFFENNEPRRHEDTEKKENGTTTRLSSSKSDVHRFTQIILFEFSNPEFDLSVSIRVHLWFEFFSPCLRVSVV